MEWAELIGVFRELGGVAENVRLGQGPFGRGIFVCDADKPAKLHASENLLVPVDDVEIRDGQMVLKAQTNVGERERRFFEEYERHFGWGAGLFEESWDAQKQWYELPDDVMRFLTAMGGLEDPHERFLPPSVESCLYRFVRTRWFTYGAEPKLAPVIDLVNYSSHANGFTIADGIGVTGRFAGEMLVRYNLGDAWGRAMSYGFACLGAFAYSLSLTADVPGGKKIAIRRDVAAADVRDGIRFPRATIDGDTIDLPFLMLGCATATDLPRAIFRNVVSGVLAEPGADRAFDGIAHFNRMQLLNLLRLLRKHDGELVRVLEVAAIDQLETLSNCIGARGAF
jgi:hypothetical protein